MADNIDVRIAAANIRKAGPANYLAREVCDSMEGFSMPQRAEILQQAGAVAKMADSGFAPDMVRFISGQLWPVRSDIMQTEGVRAGLRRNGQGEAVRILDEGIRTAAFRAMPRTPRLTLVA